MSLPRSLPPPPPSAPHPRLSPVVRNSSYMYEPSLRTVPGWLGSYMELLSSTLRNSRFTPPPCRRRGGGASQGGLSWRNSRFTPPPCRRRGGGRISGGAFLAEQMLHTSTLHSGQNKHLSRSPPTPTPSHRYCPPLPRYQPTWPMTPPCLLPKKRQPITITPSPRSPRPRAPLREG